MFMDRGQDRSEFTSIVQKYKIKIRHLAKIVKLELKNPKNDTIINRFLHELKGIGKLMDDSMQSTGLRFFSKNTPTGQELEFIVYLMLLELLVLRIQTKSINNSQINLEGDLQKFLQKAMEAKRTQSVTLEKIAHFVPETIFQLLPGSELKECWEFVTTNSFIEDKNFNSLFMQIMPAFVRKASGSYYTARWAARLMGNLVVKALQEETQSGHGTISIGDLACGAGMLLTETANIMIASHSYLPAIYGNEISALACILSELSMDTLYPQTTVPWHIRQGDGFFVTPSEIPELDVILMNPPFTRHERIPQRILQAIQSTLGTAGYGLYLHGKMSLQHYFLFQADRFLRSGGIAAYILPSNTFTSDLGGAILTFLHERRYQPLWIIGIHTPKGTFSEGCNFKEWLVILRKGTLTENSTTKVGILGEIPSDEQLDAILEESQQKLTENLFHTVLLYPTSMLFMDLSWENLFWSLPNPNLEVRLAELPLIPVGESPEVRFKTGFHSTYCDWLIFPNRWFAIAAIQNSEGMIAVIRKSDGKRIDVPQKYLMPCLREANSHQELIACPTHYVLILPDTENTPEMARLKHEIIDELAENLKKTLTAKHAKGGKVRAQLGEIWYAHPFRTGATNKLARVFTFNRYGMWRRNNLACYTSEPVTANDGFHMYEINAKWEMLLAGWWNTTLHMYDFVQFCRVPAHHVQQVLKPDRSKMRIPRFAHLPQAAAAQLRQSVLDFDTALKAEQKVLPDQLDWTARRQFDTAWLQAFGWPQRKIEPFLTELYAFLAPLIRNR
jgi:hypothetical protein